MSAARRPPLRSATVPPVQVWMRGVFPAGTGDYARQVIATALCQALGLHQDAAPPRRVQVRLGTHRDPAVSFPVVAQATLELGGCPVRAQARGATAREAIDLLDIRLRHQLDQHLAAQPTGVDSSAPPHSPRQKPANPRGAFLPRSPQTRRIVRRKPVRLALLGVDAAVQEMERRDYCFHLFTEVGTQQDSVVYRAGPMGYRFAQVLPARERLAPHATQLSWYDRPAPELSAAQATERLGMSEVPFLFFLDVDRGRGSVLYRRYDGHYGLLYPVGDRSPVD